MCVGTASLFLIFFFFLLVHNLFFFSLGLLKLGVVEGSGRCLVMRADRSVDALNVITVTLGPLACVGWSVGSFAQGCTRW